MYDANKRLISDSSIHADGEITVTKYSYDNEGINTGSHTKTYMLARKDTLYTDCTILVLEKDKKGNPARYVVIEEGFESNSTSLLQTKYEYYE